MESARVCMCMTMTELEGVKRARGVGLYNIVRFTM